MTNLEFTANDNPAVDRNFDKLKADYGTLISSVVSTGGAGGTGTALFLRYGLSNFNFPGGAALSNVMTLPHGCPTTPVSIVVTTLQPIYNPAVLLGADATNFQVQAQTIDGSAPVGGTNGLFYWLALSA